MGTLEKWMTLRQLAIVAEHVYLLRRLAFRNPAFRGMTYEEFYRLCERDLAKRLLFRDRTGRVL